MRCAEFGSVRDRGGGTSSPSPSAPPPVAISPRSTAWGDPGEEPDTAAHRVSPRTDPALRRGRGRSAAGAGGEGMPAEGYGYPCEGAGGEGVPAEVHGYPLPQARVGRGTAGEVSGYPLPKARAGRGCRQKCTSILCRRRGRGGDAGRRVWVSFAEGAGGEGMPAEVHGYLLPKARAGWRSAAGREERRPSAAYGRI